MKTAIVATVAALVMAIGASSLAQAATTVSVERAGGIVWVDAASTDPGSVQIKILSPRNDGRRAVWQRCSFASQTGGTYRCGIDAGSAPSGGWVAKVTRDGETVARTSFQL